MNTEEMKRKMVEMYESKHFSNREISRRLKIGHAVINSWLSIYKYHGLEGLLTPAYTSYPESFKLQVVHHIIETAEAYSEVAGKFRIFSRATVWKWMKNYMSQDDWALYYLKREQRNQMRKSKPENLTEQEKLQQEIELLKAENAYLKKLHALIQEKNQSKPNKK